MTAVLTLSCILWTNTTPTQVIEKPIGEYGTAEITFDGEDFKFLANVIEEKINYLEIAHVKTGAQSSGYTLQWPQNSLVVRLQVGAQQSSVDCTIKSKAGIGMTESIAPLSTESPFVRKYR